MLRRPARPAVRLALVVSLLLAACACGTPDTANSAPDGAGSARHGVRAPSPDAVFDYQLGGAYSPSPRVRVVSRDREAEPVPGIYNVCYVNAFQAQPGAAAARWWHRNHPELLLRDDRGEPVVDEDWQEPLFDISTRARRTALAAVVGTWIDGCAEDGFDAVEPDNLDSFERSGKLLSADDAAAFARLLTVRAHRRGLAVAQKNTAGLLHQRGRIGFDFAVVEECARYRECPDFAEAYGGRVFDVEYRGADFATACERWGEELSVTLRDRDVRPAGRAGHRYRHC